MNAKRTRGRTMTAMEAGLGLLTLQEAQDTLKCGRRKIYQLAEEGRLQLVKFDHATRVTDESVKKLLRDIQNTPWSATKKKSA